MKRIALIAVLAGCTDPAVDERPARISADLDRAASGQTTVIGCWNDFVFCSDGTDSMRVRWDDHEIVAPYAPDLFPNHYYATTGQIAGGDVVDIEFDGDRGSIEMPFDNEFIAAAPIHASSATTLQWTPSSNATFTELTAYWDCESPAESSHNPTLLATFDTDPGGVTIDVLASRPEDLRDAICKVSVGVTAEIRSNGDRIALLARQRRTLDLVLDEPGPLP